MGGTRAHARHEISCLSAVGCMADVITALVEAGAQLGTPLDVPPKPSAPLRRATGLLHAVLRPVLLPALVGGTFLLSRLHAPLRQWTWPATLCALLSALYSASTDDILCLALSRRPRRATPGLRCPAASPIQRILSRCAFMTKGYRGPRVLFTGDYSTLFCSLTARARPVPYQRLLLPSPHFPSESISMDFATPNRTTGACPRVVLLLAGVGSGSNAPYIEACAWHFLAQGWAVCVLLPRGLGDAPAKSALAGFDPADLSDLHAALHLLSAVFPQVYAVGFSLGACMLLNYLARFPPDPPAGPAPSRT